MPLRPPPPTSEARRNAKPDSETPPSWFRRQDDSLLVPSNSAGVALGKTPNNAGIWISPPPPATASTQPASKAQPHRKRISPKVADRYFPMQKREKISPSRSSVDIRTGDRRQGFLGVAQLLREQFLPRDADRGGFVKTLCGFLQSLEVAGPCHEDALFFRLSPAGRLEQRGAQQVDSFSGPC